jgi:hypothetical protein
LNARLWALVVMFGSFAAWACPVCGAAQDTKGTYINMTLVMSALPLVMIGSVVLGVALRFKKAEDEEKKLQATRSLLP